MSVQLCLSGGGTRGFAHLGVAEALLELDITVCRYSGTSSGAIAAAFLAAGYHPLEIMEIFESHKLMQLFGGAFQGGLLKMDGMQKMLEHYLPVSFEQLPTPLFVAATDLVLGRTVYIGKGPLFPVLLGSASIPGLFRPVAVGEYLLADGGILNNLPIEPLLDSPVPVVGVHCNPVGRWEPKMSAMSILERSFHLGVYSNTLLREHRCRVYIEPEGLRGVKVYDYSHSRDIYESGYREVMERKREELLNLG